MQQMPYQFNKSVLTREQLHDILDMREVKKIVAKKRT